VGVTENLKGFTEELEGVTVKLKVFTEELKCVTAKLLEYYNVRTPRISRTKHPKRIYSLWRRGGKFPRWNLQCNSATTVSQIKDQSVDIDPDH
jgi:hypothetical protein